MTCEPSVRYAKHHQVAIEEILSFHLIFSYWTFITKVSSGSLTWSKRCHHCLNRKFWDLMANLTESPRPLGAICGGEKDLTARGWKNSAWWNTKSWRCLEICWNSLKLTNSYRLLWTPKRKPDHLPTIDGSEVFGVSCRVWYKIGSIFFEIFCIHNCCKSPRFLNHQPA